MQNLILVINSGSSSLKFSVFKTDDSREPFCLQEGEIEGIGACASIRIKALPEAKVIRNEEIDVANHALGIDEIERWICAEFSDDKWIAVGHRIVHGGSKFVDPLVIDGDALLELRALIPFDPLHQPAGIEGIESCQRMFKDAVHIACFDTAFHSTQPEVATIIALPQFLTDQGIRRYGFHGISYQYIASTLRHIDSAVANGRTIIAHLGNGASLCAIKEGKSIATTMGFSVLDGLAMGTRCGSIDPGAILYCLNTLKIAPAELEDILYRESGLLGISGISNDVRKLLASAALNAKKALDYYVYRIVREIGSLVSALGGLDGLIFTGGVGENSSEIRQQVVTQLSWLGFQIDKVSNEENTTKISGPHSKLAIYVIHTNENQMIARQVIERIRTI